MTGELLEAVASVVADRGPVSGRGVARVVHRRRGDVSQALSALESAGRVRSTPEGWIAAGRHRGTPQTRPARVDRLRHTWQAMSPAARVQALARLSDGQRVEPITEALEQDGAS